MADIDTVKSIYEAFGRGDAGFIAERCAEDVDWEYGAVPSGVPWLQHGRGRAHVVGFFQTVGAELELSRFSIDSLLAGDRVVVALCSIRFTVRKTGRVVDEVAEPHLWHFDERGRVIRFRHASDTFAHAAAWNG